MRLVNLDLFRVLAILVIVVGHCVAYSSQFATSAEVVAGTLVALAARWTIPFFFIVSGYMFGGKLPHGSERTTAAADKAARRILALWAFWCVVYLVAKPMLTHGVSMQLPYLIAEHARQLVREQGFNLLLTGASEHLWFLVSLAMTLLLYRWMPSAIRDRYLIPVGLVFYIIGLAGGAYSDSVVGLDLPMNTRNGVFFGFLFFAIGVHLRALSAPPVAPKPAIGLALAGLCLFAVEIVLLHEMTGKEPMFVDYTVGTVPYGLGVALLAIAFPLVRVKSSPWAIRIARHAPYVFCIYAAHMIFIDLLAPHAPPFPSAAWLLLPAATFILSFATAWLLRKTPFRRFILC